MNIHTISSITPNNKDITMKRKHIILTAACAAIAFSGVFQGCGKKTAGTEEEVPQV